MSLLEATKSLLSEPDQMNRLCLPVDGENQLLVGAHLNDDEVSALHADLLLLVENVSVAVARAMLRQDVEVKNPAAVATSNGILNLAATSELSKPVDAGLITEFSAVCLDVSLTMQRLYDRFSSMGNSVSELNPRDYSYLFDLRLGGSAPVESWLQDIESAYAKMKILGKMAKKLDRLTFVYNARDLYLEHEKKSDVLRAESSVYVDELLSRAQVLASDYREIAATPNLPRLTENIAVHYFQVAEMIHNNLVRFGKMIEDERTNPGLCFAPPDKGCTDIYLSYAERLQSFLNRFRFLIIGANAVERARLLLECGVERIENKTR